MRRIYIFLIGILFSINLSAQELPAVRQYVLSPYLLNPAFAGSIPCLDIRILDRHQWIGFGEDAPNTQALTVTAPIGESHALGGYIYMDNNGPNKTKGAQFSYTHHVILGDNNSRDNVTVMAFGLSANVYQYSLDESMFQPHSTSDPLITGTVQSTINPNFGFGIYLYNRRLEMGLSVAQILNSPIELYTASTADEMERHLFFNAGYHFGDLQRFSVRPSFVVKMDVEKHKQVDVNMQFFFSSRFWTQLSYRHDIDDDAGMSSNSILAFIGLNISQNWYIAYGYDYGLTDIQNAHSGSHEIMLGFRYCYDSGRKKVHHSCPAFNLYKVRHKKKKRK